MNCGPNSNNWLSQEEHDQKSRVVAPFLLMIGILSVIGNSLIISSVYSVDKRYRRQSMHIKASLAVADIISALAMIAGGVYMLYTGLHLAYPWHQIYIVTQTTFLGISFFHLTFLSLWNCFSIALPNFGSRKLKCFLGIAAVWLVGIIGMAILNYNMWLVYVDEMYVYNLYWTVLSLYLIVPYCVTILCAVALYVVYRKKYLRVATFHDKDIQSERQHSMIVRTISFIVLGYSVVCLPMIIWFITDSCLNSGYNIIYGYIYINAPGTILMTNGIIDVAVYSCLDEDFQAHVKKLISKVKRLVTCRCGGFVSHPLDEDNEVSQTNMVEMI